MTGEPQTRAPLDLTRPMIEGEIERLISILDWLDPDPDLEDAGEDEEDCGDGEPLYGWTEMQSRFGQAYGPYGEDSDGLELDEADWEPELGSLNGLNQLHWSKGRDGEPSLGSLDFLVNQTKWSKGGTKDYEDEHDGREPCCEDEGAQCDDEGCVETDCGFDEDDPGSLPQCCADHEEREATTRACVGAISRVRHLQQRTGQKPVEPLRILGGAIMKGGGT